VVQADESQLAAPEARERPLGGGLRAGGTDKRSCHRCAHYGRAFRQKLFAPHPHVVRHSCPLPGMIGELSHAVDRLSNDARVNKRQLRL
jgi:hypothetical protein